MRVEIKGLVFDAQSPKSLNDTQIASCHRGNMESVFGVVIVVIEIQSGCAQIHFIGFFCITNLCREDAMYAGT